MKEVKDKKVDKGIKKKLALLGKMQKFLFSIAFTHDTINLW